MNTTHFEIRYSKFTLDNRPFRGLYLRDTSSMRNVAARTWELFGPDTNDRYRSLGKLTPYLHFVNYTAGGPVTVLDDIEVIQGVPSRTPVLPMTPNSWTLLPVVVEYPGHRHALLVLRRDDNIYCFDPNGVARHPRQSLDRHVLATFRSILGMLGRPSVNFSDLSQSGPWLLTSNFQIEALRFLDSNGLCGAFTTAIGIFVILNSSRTRDEIAEYFTRRRAQWAGGATALATLLRLAHFSSPITVGRPPKLAHMSSSTKQKTQSACDDADNRTLHHLMSSHPLVLALCPSIFPVSFVEKQASYLLDTVGFPEGISERRRVRADLISKGLSLSFIETYVILHIAYFRELFQEQCCLVRPVVVLKPDALSGVYTREDESCVTCLYNASKRKTLTFFRDWSRPFPSVLWVIGNRKKPLSASVVLDSDLWCFSPFPPWTDRTIEWKLGDRPVAVDIRPFG